MEKIKIAIVEDIHKVALSIKERIELSMQFEVEFIAGNGEILFEKIAQGFSPMVVLMDINMPIMDGIEATKRLKAKSPEIKIVMCTVFDEDHYIFEAILAGADGYLQKDTPPAKLHESIVEVINGGAPMSPEIARKSLLLLRNGAKKPGKQTQSEDFGLTQRELEILECISEGLSYKLVAQRLFISEGTVRKHLQNIYSKLQVHNKIEALQVANKNDLFNR